MPLAQAAFATSPISAFHQPKDETSRRREKLAGPAHNRADKSASKRLPADRPKRRQRDGPTREQHVRSFLAFQPGIQAATLQRIEAAGDEERSSPAPCRATD